MAKLVDAPRLGRGASGRAGSTPVEGTKNKTSIEASFIFFFFLEILNSEKKITINYHSMNIKKLKIGDIVSYKGEVIAVKSLYSVKDKGINLINISISMGSYTGIPVEDVVDIPLSQAIIDYIVAENDKQWNPKGYVLKYYIFNQYYTKTFGSVLVKDPYVFGDGVYVSTLRELVNELERVSRTDLIISLEEITKILTTNN